MESLVGQETMDPAALGQTSDFPPVLMESLVVSHAPTLVSKQAMDPTHAQTLSMVPCRAGCTVDGAHWKCSAAKPFFLHLCMASPNERVGGKIVSCNGGCTVDGHNFFCPFTSPYFYEARSTGNGTLLLESLATKQSVDATQLFFAGAIGVGVGVVAVVVAVNRLGRRKNVAQTPLL